MNKIIYLMIAFFATAFLYPVIFDKTESITMSGHSQREQIIGTVVSVLDGDTIKIKPNETGEILTVRFKGIDCPESDQFWGDVATKYLTVAIDQLPVTVEIVDIDRYGRTVGVVYHDNININRFMVEQGHCWVYRQYADDKRLFQLEKNAQDSAIGLWRYENPQEPWNYRKIEK